MKGQVDFGVSSTHRRFRDVERYMQGGRTIALSLLFDYSGIYQVLEPRDACGKLRFDDASSLVSIGLRDERR